MRVLLARLLLLLALGLAPALLAGWLATEALRAWSVWSGPGQPVDAAVVAAAAGAGAAVAGWLALGALVSGACVLAGSTRRPALVPVPLHRCVALLLGLALAAGSPQPPAPSPASLTAAAPGPVVAGLDPAWAPTGPGAAAAPVRAAEAAEAAPASSPAVAPDPGWRPVVAPAPSPRTVVEPIDPLLLPGSRRSREGTVEALTVHRGDTLWDLTARHLGGRATDAEIAAEWPRWYAANREVIGADPDLLVPGQQLAPPGRANPG